MWQEGVNPPNDELSITQQMNYMNQVTVAIAEDMLFSDLHKLEHKQRTRPNNNLNFDDPATNPDLDPNGSVFITYIVRGRTTDSKQMDELADEINRVTKEYLKNKLVFGNEVYTVYTDTDQPGWRDEQTSKKFKLDFRHELGRLITIYNERHPGYQASVDELGNLNADDLKESKRIYLT